MKPLIIILSILVITGVCINVFDYLGSKEKIDKANAQIKMYEFRERQWMDSLSKYRSIENTLEQEVALLAHENDSLANIERVVVHRTIVPAVSYKPTQLDSIWRKRYKY